MDSAVTIREFAWDDYPAVIALWQQAFGGTKPEDARPALGGTLERNPGLFLVAERGSVVVGTALGTFDGRRGYLYHVAVDPAVQRQGVARALLETIIPRLWALGARKIHLRAHEDNVGALAFYQTLGFTLDGPVVGVSLVRDAP
jgi:ribosomal protein S18 acetylase RimI-like enzyme